MQLFLIRGLAALVWAAGFATVSDSLTTGAAVLIVIYPIIDLVASAIDAERQHGSARTLLRADAAVSAAAAIALAIAATGDIANVLVVFGAWAVITGIGQFIVALRRRQVLGRQWPMLIAGGLSTLVGVLYIAAAGGDDPKLDPLAIYAAGGGAFFVIQAGILALRRRRLATT